MSRKKEKPVQFFLPVAGGMVNQCCYVSEDELEEKDPRDRSALLLEKAAAGKLSERSLTRYRESLLQEAVRADRAELLSALLPQRRMELARFLELLVFTESSGSPDALAQLLQYRREHYSPAELEAFEQRQLDLELGLARADDKELRKLLRLRYLREGVCVCGVRGQQHSYEIPASIGGKPVIGVAASAFYALEPMPRIRRDFAGRESAGSVGQAGERILLGRSMEKMGSGETPLPWRVLRLEAGRALVLCERAVAILPYHREPQEVTWEACDLRRWLNRVFLPLSFTEAEQAQILPSLVETRDNENFGSSGGPAAEDRLFLLSIEEALQLLPDDEARAMGCWWWLRSPGFDNAFAAAITPDGAVSRLGSFVEGDDYAVRPAMWIKA